MRNLGLLVRKEIDSTGAAIKDTVWVLLGEKHGITV
jgi:hypothetical protein